MASDWTYERVEQLAPDRKSILAARELVFPSRWPILGRLEQLVFGRVQRARSSYRVTIDTAKPAFGCDCPSRKRPCKHVLALLLMMVERPHDLTERAPPPWVEDWIAKELAKAERRSQQKKRDDDPEARAKAEAAATKRAEDREANVRAGVEDLARFLRDVVRQGIAAQAEHSFRQWDEMAKRMIDAQAPGLAKMLRTLGGIPHTGEGWPSRFLDRLARMHLLVEAYRRLDELDADVAADVRSLVGHRVRQEDVKAGPKLQDQWWVLGCRVETSENLDDDIWTRRTWLYGERTGREALVLDFNFGGPPLPVLVPGTNVVLSLAFYPGSWPVRAVIVDGPELVTRDIADIAAHAESIRDSIGRAGDVIAKQPWATRFCARLSNVYPAKSDDGWVLRGDGAEVPVSEDLADVWLLLAMSGGRAVTVFGEWQGDAVLPYAVVGRSGFAALDTKREQMR